MRKFLFLLFVVLGSVLLYEAFLEFYYYRDKVEWLFPLPSEEGLLIRRDRWGRGDFGAKRSGGRRHQGVDLLAEEGSPVVAVRSGKVRVGDVPNGMGRFVVITHRNGMRTLYGHLSEVYVKDQSRVRQGQVIGAVGKTGNASAEGVLPHLHFEIRQGETKIDPTPILSRIKLDTSS